MYHHITLICFPLLDVHDNNQLKKNGITHILAIHDNSRPLHDVSRQFHFNYVYSR